MQIFTNFILSAKAVQWNWKNSSMPRGVGAAATFDGNCLGFHARSGTIPADKYASQFTNGSVTTYTFMNIGSFEYLNGL